MTASAVAAARPAPLARRAASLRAGTLDPAAYRRALAAHIAAVEPVVTAFAAPPDLKALRDDERLPGVPSFTVKDTIDVAGLPTGLGIRAGYRRVATRSAGTVAALTGLGWVCTGKVTTTECALGTVKPSRNPHYPHVSAAGSSTGSAVSVSAGFCDVSVGSDSGGSLRWPAVYCGVTALRLTPRRDLMRGVHAVAPSMESTGLVTRTVADLSWLWHRYRLTAVAGADPAPAPQRLRAVLSAPGTEPVHREVSALLHRVRQVLDGAGHRADAAALPQVWDQRGPAAELLAREAHDSFTELAERPGVTLGADTRAAIRHGAAVSDVRYAALRERQDEAAAMLVALLHGPYDVLIMPLETGLPDLSTVAPRADGALSPSGAGSTGASLTLVANFARLPVLAMPLTLSGQQSPLGIQILAAPGGEHILLAAGALLEKYAADGRFEPVP